MTERRAIIVVGLGFGDEGKGNIVDYLVRQTGAHTVMRYNGGAQAAHNVVTPDGRHHTFAQFGSGTLVPGTRTHLSRYMLVEPLSLMREYGHLRALGVADALQRLTVHRGALITTPYHQAANRLREWARRGERHGSCGRGIGETMSDYLTYGERVLLAGDLTQRATLLRKLKFIREQKLSSLRDVIASLSHTETVQKEWSVLGDPTFDDWCANAYVEFAHSVRIVDDAYERRLFSGEGTIIFEGAQGVLLDEYFGFHPYTTWSTTTLRNAHELLREHDYTGDVLRLGVLRTYATRHGAGPFVSEDAELTAALPEPHNANNHWQREFRVGHFDSVAVRYALDIVGGLDGVALTHLDRLASVPVWPFVDGYYGEGLNEDVSLTYFDQDERGKITRIRPALTPDLGYQEQLTRRLFKCRANVSRLDAPTANLKSQDRCQAFVDRVEQQFRLCVAIASHGPTVAEKRTNGDSPIGRALSDRPPRTRGRAWQPTA